VVQSWSGGTKTSSSLELDPGASSWQSVAIPNELNGPRVKDISCSNKDLIKHSGKGCQTRFVTWVEGDGSLDLIRQYPKNYICIGKKLIYSQLKRSFVVYLCICVCVFMCVCEQACLYLTLSHGTTK
jgi:hypothetical protein